MCGIVGAVAQRDIAEILLEGLRRLEYRGYDSAGLAVVDAEGHMTRLRRLGKVQMLAQAAEEHPLHGGTGIAHTRWATHGEPSEGNAHPHVSEHIVVVHNGIIENHEPLREELKARGYTFVSETDTEVIAHLVHWELEQGGTLRDAVLRAIPQLRGAYGTVIMDSRDPSTLLAARSGSPMVIGLGMGENFIASDQLALLPVTRRFIFLEEGDIAEVTRRNVTVFEWLRQYAYRNVRHYKHNVRNFVLWQSHLNGKALERNGDLLVPLAGNEVWHIAKSVSKWTWHKFDLAASDARFSQLQAHRSKQGNLARWGNNEDKQASARLMAVAGRSVREIAAELDVGKSTVARWIAVPSP